ncbi:Sua5/YciO/YrdC/YwlC family protein [Anaeromyxobacter sp. Fw109-5]|uniref:Sua5/YciO/YrdC/YwlC family protein n=1 Tax=Anaeromyxobacter sp. (strain Fw109-5) TaxID=404589 RepID=UPI0000ED7969|nr:Sua5/YciO/YrdC/YwlC family protein [Anaeromyxobacter sp. Fw109-5]ABS24733.1 zinc finger HypF domain protein [Anaeromyxobacter sp. Fw109-5]
MASFVMCEACAREYADPCDRRFHAQPNACPACGPRVRVVARDGAPVEAADPIGHVGRALAAGAIAAVKGIGGFHLACDGTSSAAVVTLRARKRREEKPLAVMVRDLDEARRVAEVGEAEAALLTSVERPIVLNPIARPRVPRLVRGSAARPPGVPPVPSPALRATGSFPPIKGRFSPAVPCGGAAVRRK